MRRVVVEARIVRLKLGRKTADAYLRHLQRDGMSREEEERSLESYSLHGEGATT
jgi:hypothetical protein